MEPQHFDLIVIGGGNAIALARNAAQAGRRVAVIERDLLGGTCPNRGCIPSKLLLGYAHVAHTIRDAARFHIDAELRSIDGDALLAETRASTIEATDPWFADNLPEGLTLFRGHGRFVGERTVEVTADLDGTPTTHRLTAETVVIGTGSRPRRPQLGKSVPYWTSRDVFSLEHLPRSLVIVGGGYIGCELAHFFHAVGVPTRLLHRGPELMEATDRDVRSRFTEAFVERVPTRLETDVVEVEVLRDESGRRFALTVEGPDGDRERLETDELLYAIGRVPNSDQLGCEAGGVELDARGHVVIDDHLRTSAEGVYALGDVTGGYQFTHSASKEAQYLEQVLLHGHDEPLDYGPMPAAAFTHPEVASVGRTQDELDESGEEYLVASAPYTSAAKGRAMKERHGLVKFLFRPSGEILGCHIVGEQASVLLHEVIPVMKWRNHVSSLTEIIHVHPSLPEVVRNAARKAHAMLQG